MPLAPCPHPIMMIQNVSRHGQVAPGGAKSFSVKSSCSALMYSPWHNPSSVWYKHPARKTGLLWYPRELGKRFLVGQEIETGFRLSENIFSSKPHDFSLQMLANSVSGGSGPLPRCATEWDTKIGYTGVALCCKWSYLGKSPLLVQSHWQWMDLPTMFED
jgi:hypothetical protein